MTKELQYFKNVICDKYTYCMILFLDNANKCIVTEEDQPLPRDWNRGHREGGMD